ncbi:GNAT family N-acetyltransferase [Campylobacter geochelonis]|uniref:Ribosomal-protein-alanine acetyltransferase n=1 Tax=Campylobacter geochelonis TaxID=1780362 RepID=A0A128ECQ0_9BACT|nr:GNAT family N-acetyltransferase [Campylobacter geochelonis]QKF72092.1 acetyltransferase [Campylobacter geochelonis]CZE45885.1 ribosomal-protein-alanine acetyltransferase [Campylobacter geochelonis]CZE46750.1 ribosomal-protein-alanine acetyltransferase [Campylobacter geochelonis]
MKNLTIIENSADFKPSDFDEIMLSIGWTTPEIISQTPSYAEYDMFRSYDYYLVAKIGDKAVGILQATCDKDRFDTAYFYCVVVHKEYQRKGVARALLREFNKKFSHTIIRTIMPKNKTDGAALFLAKFGFENISKNYDLYSRSRELGFESKKINVEIVENLPDIGIDEYKDILNSNFIDTDDINSTLLYKMCGVYHYYAIAKIDGKSVGIITAITDRDAFATTYLNSILVHKDYADNLVYEALLVSFLKRFSHTTIWAIVPKKQGLDVVLKNFGFRENSANFTPFIKLPNEFKH